MTRASRVSARCLTVTLRNSASSYVQFVLGRESLFLFSWPMPLPPSYLL